MIVGGLGVERERARMGLGRSRKIYEGIEGKIRGEKTRGGGR